MAICPWLAWYPSDYIGDTSHLSLEEHGAYCLLLFHAWMRGGEIPSDPRELRRIWGVSLQKTRKIWAKIRPLLFEKDGHFYSRKLMNEIGKAIERQKKAETAAYARWNAPSNASSNASRARDPTTTTTEEKERDLNLGQKTASSANGASRFSEWWAGYPKKVKKRESEKVWRSKHLDDKADQLIADVARRRREDRRWLDGFCPDPTTYLRGERWDDEVTRASSSGTHQPSLYTKPIPGVDV